MIKYDLTLEKQRLIGADKFSIAANANETVCLCFHFDRSWRRFDSKAAVFRNSASEYYIIEITSDRAKVPWEVLTRQGEFELSVIGFEGEKVITSDKVEILVSESLLPEDCKTFSPSEVLFDRFKRECIAQAYLDYEDEINELKKAHIAEKMLLGEQIIEANKRTKEAVEEKNKEISELETSHNIEKNSLNNKIAQLNKDIDYYKEKADKWDMVDYALSLKTTPSYALWAGGSAEYSLPMLNTSSITAFSANNFSSNLKEIGLDLSAVKTFTSVFNSNSGIEKIELINTKNVESFANAFEGCKLLKRISIDSLEKCSTMYRFANGDTLLQEVDFGTVSAAGNYERAFLSCSVLKEINGCFDMSFATNVTLMFTGCPSLETVRFVEGSIGKSMDFSSCVRLSKESMCSIFKGLYPTDLCSLTISMFAFENNFTEDEREEWIDFITNTKGWELNIV